MDDHETHWGTWDTLGWMIMRPLVSTLMLCATLCWHLHSSGSGGAHTQVERMRVQASPTRSLVFKQEGF